MSKLDLTLLRLFVVGNAICGAVFGISAIVTDDHKAEANALMVPFVMAMILGLLMWRILRGVVERLESLERARDTER